MGYFSNGSEGGDYEDRFCAKCIHGQSETVECPVLALHARYNYDQHDKDSMGRRTKRMLETLIPRGEDGLFNARCAMYVKTWPDPATTHEPAGPTGEGRR